MIKTQVEDCFELKLSWLLREGHIKDHLSDERVKLRNYRGVVESYLTLRITGGQDRRSIWILDTRQYITLESTACKFGGLRYWFVCPKCSRRCLILYRPAWNEGFACRRCHDLIYRSSANSHGGYIRRLSSILTRRAKYRWVRKRDRREDYRPRGFWLAPWPIVRLGMRYDEAFRCMAMARILGDDLTEFSQQPQSKG